MLRFWESRFSQISPMKKGGGRRYYRPEDIALLSGIRALLYDDGLSIKKVQAEIKAQGISSISTRGRQGIPSTVGGEDDIGAAHVSIKSDDQIEEPYIETDKYDADEIIPESEEEQSENRDRLTGALQKLLNARERLNDTLQKH